MIPNRVKPSNIGIGYPVLIDLGFCLIFHKLLDYGVYRSLPLASNLFTASQIKFDLSKKKKCLQSPMLSLQLYVAMIIYKVDTPA